MFYGHIDISIHLVITSGQGDMIKKVSYNDILLLPCKEQSHIFSSWYQRENYHRLKNTICLWFRRFRVFFRHTLAYLWGSGYFGDESEAWNFRSAVYTNSSSSSASLLLRNRGVWPVLWCASKSRSKTRGKTKKEEDDWLIDDKKSGLWFLAWWK